MGTIQISVLSNHFENLHVNCGWWKEEHTYWFLVNGSKLWQFVYKTLWAWWWYRLFFDGSLSNFTYKLFVMIGETLILSPHKQPTVCGGGWVGVLLRVSVTLYLVDSIESILTTVFAESFSNFMWQLSMMRRNPIDFGSQGQMSRSTLVPYERMPDFAICQVSIEKWRLIEIVAHSQVWELVNVAVSKEFIPRALATFFYWLAWKKSHWNLEEDIEYLFPVNLFSSNSVHQLETREVEILFVVFYIA